MPTADDFAARDRCVRQAITQMVADPAENSRGISDMADFAVGRCSRAVWDKMMHSTRSLDKGDDLILDQLSAKQEAMSDVIQARQDAHTRAP
jgi:hypothetical protein